MKKTKFNLLFEDIMSQFDNDDDPSITQVIDEIQYDDDTIIEIYQNNDSKKFGYSIAMGKVGGQVMPGKAPLCMYDTQEEALEVAKQNI